MRKGYEERYLMTVLSAVMNQKTTPEPMRQLDWGKVYRLADYHHVAHLVYYGIMGLAEEIPEAVRRRFFQKYLEAVHRVERFSKTEKQLKYLMEKEKIGCFFLDYLDSLKHYPIEEMCCREFIEIGSEIKNTDRIEKLLRIRDFVERPTEESGNIYYRIPGVKVFFYNYNIFLSRRMRKFYKNMLKQLPRKKGFIYIKDLQPDDQYLFLMCRLTDSYAKGEVSLNQIIDFWIFYKKYAENFSWKYIYEKLKILRIEEFAEKLENLILRWFGTGVGIENVEIYDAMESYILSKGVDGREISSKFLPLIKTVADCYARNRKAEQFYKLLQWAFPDRNYMETIYPIIEKSDILLPMFWIIRLVRYSIRVCYSKINQMIIRNLVKEINRFILLIPLLSRRKHLVERHNDINVDNQEELKIQHINSSLPQTIHQENEKKSI